MRHCPPLSFKISEATGIARPSEIPDRLMIPLAGYVLGGFDKEETKLMEDAVERAACSIECILERGIEIAMGEYNITKPACPLPR